MKDKPPMSGFDSPAGLDVYGNSWSWGASESYVEAVLSGSIFPLFAGRMGDGEPTCDRNRRTNV